MGSSSGVDGVRRRAGSRSSELQANDDGSWHRRETAAGRPRDRDRDRESRPALEHLQVRNSPLWETWKRLSTLSKDLQAILPSIPLRPLKLEKQTLVVTAASSAMAARLRQYEPRLLDGLQARGWLVSRIRFKPSALYAQPRPPARLKDLVPPRGLAAIEALANAPDTSEALRTSLLRFVRKQRSYREV
ncbi:MAG: DciA family protein [Lautropia sp.]|nr:DciA family protein [Lautropia sp.]